MNTSPFVDSRKTSQEIWEEFSLSFTPAVQEVVDFAKRIPGFRDLPENDQVGLLKAGTFEVGSQNPTPPIPPKSIQSLLCFEGLELKPPPPSPTQVLMVRFASLFNMVERTVTFLSGKRYSLDTLRSLGAGELLNSMCEFSEKLVALRLDADEMSLFTAVVLVSAGEDHEPDGSKTAPFSCDLIFQTLFFFCFFFLCLRPFRHPEPERGGGPAGKPDPGLAEPGDAEPRRRRVHHLHQAAAQASRAALPQQPALGGAALLHSSPLNSSSEGSLVPPASTHTHTHPHLYQDLPLTASTSPSPTCTRPTHLCVSVARMYHKELFYILFLLKVDHFAPGMGRPAERGNIKTVLYLDLAFRLLHMEKLKDMCKACMCSAKCVCVFKKKKDEY